MRCDRGAILPARGDQVLQVEHGGRLAGIQLQCLAVDTAGGRDQVVHNRQQAGDPFDRQFQDAAVGEAGDHLAIDDPGRRDAATLAQAQQDRQQRMAHAVNLDAEVEREFSAWRIGNLHVARAD